MRYRRDVEGDDKHKGEERENSINIRRSSMVLQGAAAYSRYSRYSRPNWARKRTRKSRRYQGTEGPRESCGPRKHEVHHVILSGSSEPKKHVGSAESSAEKKEIKKAAEERKEGGD